VGDVTGVSAAAVTTGTGEPTEAGRVLVAGIGNVFLGDDGFGVEVAGRIAPGDLPDGVDVADFGIRGIHLAYELLDGRHHTLVLVDAIPLGKDAPGTLAVLEVEPDDVADEGGPLDAHSMSPHVVLAALASLGGRIERVLVVGCQPADVSERMGLSEPVAAAVDEAARLALDVASEQATLLRDGKVA
jgi:hydrogenase maturation protease